MAHVTGAGRADRGGGNPARKSSGGPDCARLAGGAWWLLLPAPTISSTIGTASMKKLGPVFLSLFIAGVALAGSCLSEAAQVRDASVRTPLDDQTELILCGSVIEADDRRMVSAFATHASAILSRHALVREAQTASNLAKDNRTSTALLASVSHDLRTPLAGIKVAVSSLRKSDISWSPTDEADLLEAIEVSADHLNAMVGTLLDISPQQTGNFTTQVQKHTIPA